MSGDTREFNNTETQAVIKLFFFTPFWQKHYGNMHHRMPPSKTGWPSLNVVIFPPVMRLVLDDPKQWRPRGLLIKFTNYSWKTAGFRLNQKLSNWASHVSGLGPSFVKIRTCGSSPWSWSQNAWTRIKNVNGVIRLRKFWNFFGAIQMISCRSWWPWTKPGYITMTRRQSNHYRNAA